MLPHIAQNQVVVPVGILCSLDEGLVACVQQIQVPSCHKHPSCPFLFFARETLQLANGPGVNEATGSDLLSWKSWLYLLLLLLLGLLR